MIRQPHGSTLLVNRVVENVWVRLIHQTLSVVFLALLPVVFSHFENAFRDSERSQHEVKIALEEVSLRIAGKHAEYDQRFANEGERIHALDDRVMRLEDVINSVQYPYRRGDKGARGYP